MASNMAVKLLTDHIHKMNGMPIEYPYHGTQPQSQRSRVKTTKY